VFKKIQYWKKKMAKNNSDVEEYPYGASILAYNREMDQLVEIDTITCEVEEDDSKACAYEGKMESDDEE
jgi:hypothetical protein